MFSFHSVHKLEIPKLLLAFKNIVTILILVEKAYEDIKTNSILFSSIFQIQNHVPYM